MKIFTFKTLGSSLFFLIFSLAYSQNISGKVTDDEGYPIDNVIVTVANKNVVTDKNGNYSIEITAQSTIISFSKEGYISFQKNINDKTKTLYVQLQSNLSAITFQTKRKTDLTSIELSPEKAIAGPSISGGIEDIMKTFPSISSNTELSSQYMVRGGNYDENLIYVNGIEVYRPQLVRNGQQEGMSILNPSMISLINFSAGGFEAKYGDKMSSVLDIYYKKPKSFEGFLEASLIGGAVTLGYGDKKNKFSAIIGARYRNTNFILNTLDEETDFNPKYQDVQTFLEYRFSPKISISFLGSFAQNDFEMQPKSRETEFGTLSQPILLTILYRGHENDKFITKNGSFSLRLRPVKKFDITLSAFAFHSMEEEYFDIAAGYMLQEINPSTGAATASFDAGGQIDHARNDLDILVTGTQMQSIYKFNENTSLQFGAKYQQEDIRDLQKEWQLLDSIGYSVPRDPYEPGGNLDDSNLELNYIISAKNYLKSTRINGFVQFDKKFMLGKSKALFNIGTRITNWDYNNETNISPRMQFAIKPEWEKDMNFRFAVGLYYQPPFYKELRYFDGSLNPNIQSQRSMHFVLGNDYEFKIWKRPFKVTTEIYYKKMDDLIPYFVDNVRIKYTAENNSTGRAYGIESRLNGEFVPGIESWFSLSYAKAEQNINDRGFIPLPTDPRIKASLFFQDEMPFMKRMKASVNVIYASGLPNGAPYQTDPYQYQSTLSAYKRADIGLSYTLADSKEYKINNGMFSKLKELSLGLQIYNAFDIRNTISNQWIRDLNSSRIIAVPYRLTGRFFNLRLIMRF